MKNRVLESNILQALETSSEAQGPRRTTAGEAEWQWSHEIGRRPLLSAAEEVALAKRIEMGDEAAREEFVESNLKLVVSIAKRYRGCGVPMEDLIQEGNLGLIKAVDKYDWRKGCRFSTVAVIWIEGQIRRSIGNLRHNIHLPLRVVADLHRINRVADELSQHLGRSPSVAEVAAAMKTPVAHVQDLLELPGDPVSMDDPLDEELATQLADLVEDDDGVQPDEFAATQDTRRQVRDAVSRMSPRQQTVLRMRFGIDGEREHTLEEIGGQLGLTRQRVRQIEVAALEQIRDAEGASLAGELVPAG